MSKRGIYEEDVEYPNVKKKKLDNSPTSINVLKTAEIFKDDFLTFNGLEQEYLLQYIFNVHDIVCPQINRLSYDEIRTNRNQNSVIRAEKSISGIDELIDFVENKCKDYRFIGSILNLIYYVMPDDNEEEIKNNPLPFFFMIYYQKKDHIGINEEDENVLPHSNAILIDRELKQVERFEPHGTDTFMESDNMDKLIEESFSKIGYKYFSPKTFCPANSVQTIHGMATNPLYQDAGYCAIWSLWYMDTRLLNPSKSRDEMIEMIIDMLKNNDEKFIHETIHFYWTNLDMYIEFIRDGMSPTDAIESIYNISVAKLGENKLSGGKRVITKYVKKHRNKVIQTPEKKPENKVIQTPEKKPENKVIQTPEKTLEKKPENRGILARLFGY